MHHSDSTDSTSSSITLAQNDERYTLVLPDARTDHIQRIIATSNAPYELEMLQDMRQRLSPGDLVLDIGAHIGNHTVYLAKVAHAQVVCFEPNSRLYAVLAENIQRNSLEARAIAHNIALGQEHVQARFEKAIPDNPGAQRLIVGSGEISVTRLDSMSFDRPVRAIKIDVEGMELDVLDGGRKLIEHDRPVLYVECQDESSFRQFMKWAELNRYTYWDTFNATPTHLMLPLEAASQEAAMPLVTGQSYRLGKQLYKAKRDTSQARTQLVEVQVQLQKMESAKEALATEIEKRDTKIAELSATLSHSQVELDLACNRASSLESRLESLTKTLRNRVADLMRSTATLEAEKRDHDKLRGDQNRKLKRTEAQLSELSEHADELEARLSAILSSNSWRVTAPVRTIMRWIRGRKTPESFVTEAKQNGNGAPDVFQDKRKELGTEARPRQGELPVSDIARKLWGGFSSHALEELRQRAQDKTRSPDDRVQASWNLARWMAAHNDWDACLTHLGTIARLDKRFYRSKRTRILLIEANIRIGKAQKAIELAEYALTKSSDGNYLCGISNALLSESHSLRDEHGRLDTINQIFRNAGLAELSLRDPASGLTFDNLTSTCEPIKDPDSPLVSILVAVYNASAFLETAIRSLFAQSWQNIEIVAVDDSSTDRSWELLQRLAIEDSRLKIFRNETNVGAYPTRNRALINASGDLITVHDSDDWSHPQMIEVQASSLLATHHAKANFSAMARVQRNLEFTLRPERANLEYVHRSYPSLMIRRGDLDSIGQWDSVAANADDEFVQRIRAVWGGASLDDILPTTPLSFFLRHSASLTEQNDTHLRSLTFGVRHEYAKQAEFWRMNILPSVLDKGGLAKRTDLKTPFPIPSGLARKDWSRNRLYDLIIVSDLGLQGGTRRCNEGYIEAASALGMKIGLFHWPRYDLRLSEIASDYRRMSYRQNVDILVPQDTVECRAVLIHHPPILRHRIDAVPAIKTGRVGILVNQLPMQLRGDIPRYYNREAAEALCVELFGQQPTWMPISPLVRRSLSKLGYQDLDDRDWYPPLASPLNRYQPVYKRYDRGTDEITVGRHSRDHWTKWPDDPTKLRAAYCADTDFSVRFMGGTSYAKRILGTLPANWESIDFDKVPVTQFLSEIDVFLHFVHDDYIEEFGRNVMEAMALGIPAVLPHTLHDTFEDSATYCDPEEVLSVIRRIVADRDHYSAMSRKGFEFVRKNADQPVVIERLKRFVQS